MRFSLLGLMVLACGAARSQTNAEYPLTLHVAATRAETKCSVFKGDSLCEWTQTLRANVEGRQFEMQSEMKLNRGLVALGDYPARLAKDEHKPTNEFAREYVVRFPDGTTRTFSVIAEE